MQSVKIQLRPLNLFLWGGGEPYKEHVFFRPILGGGEAGLPNLQNGFKGPIVKIACWA